MATHLDAQICSSDTVDRGTHFRTDRRRVDLGQQSGMS